MKRLRARAMHHAILISLVVSCLTARLSGQMTSAKQEGTTAGRQLSGQEVRVLLDGIKKIYGFEPDTGKLRVAEGRKADRILESLELTGTGAGGLTCSSPAKHDVVSGVIIAEDKNLVYVDAKPCELQLYSIRKPYSKTKVGSVSCKGKTLDRYAITQR
jgi:hypothetical protein